MSGIEDIPIRAPKDWDPKWFEAWVKEAIALLDSRNIISADGLISGNASTKATISFADLPTSSAGLDTGQLWNDAGTVKVKT